MQRRTAILGKHQLLDQKSIEIHANLFAISYPLVTPSPLPDHWPTPLPPGYHHLVSFGWNSGSQALSENSPIAKDPGILRTGDQLQLPKVGGRSRLAYNSNERHNCTIVSRKTAAVSDDVLLIEGTYVCMSKKPRKKYSLRLSSQCQPLHLVICSQAWCVPFLQQNEGVSTCSEKKKEKRWVKLNILLSIHCHHTVFYRHPNKWRVWFFLVSLYLRAPPTVHARFIGVHFQESRVYQTAWLKLRWVKHIHSPNLYNV